MNNLFWNIFFFWTLLIVSPQMNAQSTLSNQHESEKNLDSIIGSNHAYRNWWDVIKYNISLKIDPKTKYLSGYNDVLFEAPTLKNILQIDLWEPYLKKSMII